MKPSTAYPHWPLLFLVFLVLFFKWVHSRFVINRAQNMLPVSPTKCHIKMQNSSIFIEPGGFGEIGHINKLPVLIGEVFFFL